jgi:hypothetical protein
MQAGAPDLSSQTRSRAAGQQLNSGKNTMHPCFLHSAQTDSCLLVLFDIGHPFWRTIGTIFATAPSTTARSPAHVSKTSMLQVAQARRRFFVLALRYISRCRLCHGAFTHSQLSVSDATSQPDSVRTQPCTPAQACAHR